MKKSIHSPVAEKIQYVAEEQEKYPNNIKAQNKEKKTYRSDMEITD